MFGNASSRWLQISCSNTYAFIRYLYLNIVYQYHYIHSIPLPHFFTSLHFYSHCYYYYFNCFDFYRVYLISLCWCGVKTWTDTYLTISCVRSNTYDIVKVSCDLVSLKFAIDISWNIATIVSDASLLANFVWVST